MQTIEEQSEITTTQPKQDITSSTMILELPSWDHFKCQRHPQFKVDALNPDHDNDHETRLICIKCIIDDNLYSTPDGKRLLTIKDLMQKYFESQQDSEKPNVTMKNSIEDKFLDFLTQDYIGIYERHLEKQFRVIDQEIQKVVENLTKLKDKYKAYYAEELVNVRVKAENVKKKINKYLDDHCNNENASYSSILQQIQQFNSLKTTDQFSKFVKQIYSKYREITEHKPFEDQSQTLQELEEFKIKASNLDEKVPELYYFNEMNKTIEILLKPNSFMFKQPKGLESLSTQTKMSNSSTLKQEQTGFSMAPLKLENHFSSSPFKESIFHEYEPYKPSDYLITNRNKKRVRFFDIDSQSLRNIKKEIDEKENADPSMAVQSTKEKLYDWINRRITGYLIFQNTIHSDRQTLKNMNGTEMGVHLNHLIGQKWKNLSSIEREEYKTIAKKYRKLFKEDVDDHEDQGELNHLFEKFDCQIKKIKRQ